MWIKNETWSGMKKSQIIRAIVNEIQRIEAENLPEKENNSITVLKCVWDGLRIQWDLLTLLITLQGLDGGHTTG